MGLPKLNDPVTRVSGGDSNTPAVSFRVSAFQVVVFQVVADASASGTIELSGSLDEVTYPVIKTVTLSASSKHLYWFEDMPLHFAKIDLSGMTGGTVTVKTAGSEQ